MFRLNIESSPLAPLRGPCDTPEHLDAGFGALPDQERFFVTFMASISLPGKTG